jgi:hypothetical protein
MTPQEKSEELVLKYLRLQEKDSYNWFNKGLAKQCALIAVDELIYETQFEVPNIRQIWWIEVKKEIEKL